MIKYVYRDKEYHFDATTEWLVRLPVTALCRCGHEKQQHSAVSGVFQMGRCVGINYSSCNAYCACNEFQPNRLPYDFVQTIEIIE